MEDKALTQANGLYPNSIGSRPAIARNPNPKTPHPFALSPSNGSHSLDKTSDDRLRTNGVCSCDLPYLNSKK